MRLKSVFALLSLCWTTSASAFGLGELEVRSALGQPLHATVTLLEPAPDTTAACFSLGTGPDHIGPPLRAQLSIQHVGSKVLLHIRTTSSINDPVVQFALTTDCEGRLQRDYVMLLDPPVQVVPPSVQDAVALPGAEASVPPLPVEPEVTAPRKPKALPRHRKRAAPATVRAATTTTAQAAPAPRLIAEPGPRLVLSGKRQPLASLESPVSLRLDTNLPDPARTRPTALTPTELSDENTALARRLAHLEAQLVALQQRNAALEARNTPAAPTAPAAAAGPVQWPTYLLIAGVLGAGLALGAGLLRRRQRPRAVLLDDTPWPEADASLKTLSQMTRESLAAAPEPEVEAQRMSEIAAPLKDEGTEVKEDILDQAEVFMAHGHADLAIHLLQEHVRAAPTESPVPWLLLLDLLHRAGDNDGYAAASAECRRYFNINLTGHPISQDNENSEGLEAYPHLLEQLVLLWNTPQIDAFFHDLIYDDRGGTRMGFEPGAYRDILLLRSIAHDSLALAA